MQLSQRVPAIDYYTEEILQSALDALFEEGSDTCSYNSSFYSYACFGGHRIIKKLDVVDGAVVMRIFQATFAIPEYEDFYCYDEDGERVLDEDGNPVEAPEDEWDDLIEAYYDSLEQHYDEVAQIWLMPDGTLTTLAIGREDKHYDDTNGFLFDTPMRPVPLDKVDDLLYYDYTCYDERDEEYGIIDERSLQDRTTAMSVERMLTMLNEHCAVASFDAVAERLHDQKAECLRHWSLDTLYASYVMNGMKSAAARHFHTIKIATRNKFVPTDQKMWMQLLDTIALCNGNLQDPRIYAPKDLAAAMVEWSQRNERRLARINREAELKRIEQAERRYLENKAVIDQENVEYYRDKRPFLAVRFDTETMEFHVLQDVREFFEEGVAQGHCVFNNKYYKMPDYIVMSCTDKKTGKRLSTVTIDVERQSIVANLGSHNHVPRNEKEIAETVVSHMPMFVQANAERMAERRSDYVVDEADIKRQESERRINAHFAADRQRERDMMAAEEQQLMAV